MIKKAMIMAAGVGSRLDPLTQNTPKPIAPVANVPIIELIMLHLKNFGITEVVANTHFLAEKIHDKFKNNNTGVKFNYVHEEKLSGTAGGVKKCESFFDNEETFIVVSGDALTDINIKELVNKHKTSGAIATMALKEVPMEQVKNFGVVVIDENSRVIGFQEKPDISEAKSNLVNTGVYVFEKKIFDYIPANTFYDFAKNVFPALMANDEKLCAYVVEEYWCDIGTLAQYKEALTDIFDGKVKVQLPYSKTELGFISKSAVISDNAKIKGCLIIGDNSVVNSNVEMQGYCAIGNNCIIEEGARVINSIIWDNVKIGKNAVLENCIIASNSEVDHNSRVLAGSVYGDSSIITEKELSSAN